jgi:hypothetical protein
MDSEIILRNVTAAAAYFVELLMRLALIRRVRDALQSSPSES